MICTDRREVIMTKDYLLQVRMTTEEKNKLEHLFEYYRLKSMSELIRLLIQFAYVESRYLEYYIERERDE
jgi:hypothetical protein